MNKAQKPTDILKKEHKIIRDIIKILEVCARKIEEGKEVDFEILRKNIDSIKTFTHKYHRRKEEGVLYRIVGEKKLLWGVDDVTSLLYEHDAGAEHIRNLATTLENLVKRGVSDKKAKKAFLKNIYGYVSLLSAHFLQEEKVIYPIIERILSNREQENILKSFERLEEEMVNVGDKDRYENMIKEYKKKLDIH